MRPTVGRIVMYTNLGDKDGKYPPEQQAAVITKVTPSVSSFASRTASTLDEQNYAVRLYVIYPSGTFHLNEPVPFSKEYKRGHWSWPARA